MANTRIRCTQGLSLAATVSKGGFPTSIEYFGHANSPWQISDSYSTDSDVVILEELYRFNKVMMIRTSWPFLHKTLLRL